MTALIRCTGRPVDHNGQPHGAECGRTYHVTAGRWGRCDACADPNRRDAHLADVTQGARAAGWRISPPAPDGTVTATCPSCSRPDPALTALCRDLERSIT